MESSITSPEDQTVTFIELFFDLVFVFSITQVVYLVSHNFNLEGVFQGILVFWLVWWSWTQFTWALNAANTEHSLIQSSTLIVTAVGFLMAIAIPNSFEDRSLWFIGPYIITRIIGLILYGMVGRQNKIQFQAIQIFAFASILGLVAALVGGIVQGILQYLLWSSVVIFDIFSALIGGRQEGWGLYPDHFSERHGLFVIIVLGESLIVVGAGISQTIWTGGIIVLALLALSITFGFWWSYFHQTKPLLDQAFEEIKGNMRTRFARDVYSFLHYMIIAGIIGFAIAIETIMSHPDDPVQLKVKTTLIVGFFLFLVGLILAVWRATGHLNWIKASFIGVFLLGFLFIPVDESLEVLTVLVLIIFSILGFIQRDIGQSFDLSQC